MPTLLQNPMVGRIAAAAVSGMQSAAARQDNDLSPKAVSDAKSTIATEVAKAIDQSPELQHLTSSEAWYQSRANWSAILSGVTALSTFQYLFTKFTGIEWSGIPAADMEAYSLILSLVAGGVASYLARRARTATKPLGA